MALAHCPLSGSRVLKGRSGEFSTVMEQETVAVFLSTVFHFGVPPPGIWPSESMALSSPDLTPPLSPPLILLILTLIPSWFVFVFLFPLWPRSALNLWTSYFLSLSSAGVISVCYHIYLLTFFPAVCSHSPF